MRLIPRLQLRPRLGRRAWTLSGGLAFLLLVEMSGSRIRTDAGDALALCLLFAAAPIFSRLCWGSTLAWVARLGLLAARLRKRFAPWHFDIGVDLRLRPAFPAGVPPVLVAACGGLTLAGALVAARILYLEPPLRALVAPVFYLGWLTGLGLLWAALLAAIALMLLLPPAFLHDQFAARWTSTGPRPHRVELACIAAYFASALIAALLLPAWVPSAMMVALIAGAIIIVWTPPRPRLFLLWRARTTEGLFALSWRAFSSLVAFLTLVPILLLSVAAIGPTALGLPQRPADMPITAAMGHLLAWLSAWGMAVLAWVWFLQVRLWSRRDPASPAPTTLYVTGAGSEDEARLRRETSRRGWRVRFPPVAPEATDVRIELEDAPAGTTGEPPAGEESTLEGRPAPPLRARRSALEIPEFYEVLARRDVLQRQKMLLDVLTALVARAARYRHRQGTGFWIAPQYWWCSAMSRDTDEGGNDDEGHTMVSGIIPPYYHRVLPQPVRHHAHLVFGALAVDLIFLEDHVGAPGLRHVLQRMFAHYERYQGRRRIEETDLQGLPSVRVLVHDFEHAKPLRRQGYPEPDYEDLGRARIVHVFRNRGGPENEVDPSLDLDALLAGVR